MKRYFTELFEYNLWANQRLLGAIGQHQGQDDAIFNLMSHIVSAQFIWLQRVEGLPTSPFPPWEVYNLREIESMANESNTLWIKFLNNYKLDTLEEVIHYQNSAKKDFENRLVDIINHVINHSTHHRAQVSLMLRQLDIAPPQTDYIVFKRL